MLSLMFKYNILNIEIFNDLNNWNDTLKSQLKLSLGGSKLLILSLNHSLNWFIRKADSFRNKARDCLYEWVIESLTH